MIDTGSTLVFLPRDIITRVFRNVKGLRRDFSGQYVVPCKADNLPDISISMNNNNYTIAPKNYVITSGAVRFFFVHLIFFSKACNLTNNIFNSFLIQLNLVIPIFKKVHLLLMLFLVMVSFNNMFLYMIMKINALVLLIELRK